MAQLLLDPSDVPALQRYLRTRGWVRADEAVVEVAKAGEGNMNLTLRVTTDRRSLIVKQGRPWVEKHPTIAAPLERTAVEAEWYALVEPVPELATRLPGRLGLDVDNAVLALTDLGDRPDRLDLYERDVHLAPADLDGLVDWLGELHRHFAGAEEAAGLENRAMRALNHVHIFVIPFQPGNGLDLEAHTPGLPGLAAELQADPALVAACARLGEAYLAPPGADATLLHGDYYPGSWLAGPGGDVVIDPEFGFYGTAAFDLGVLLAHLALADQAPELAERAVRRYDGPADAQQARRFAAVEVLRRLLGVSQLPLPLDLAEKRALAERAQATLVA